MTDRALAAALGRAAELEQTARECYEQTTDAEERDAAIGLVRLVAPVRRGLERWILARSTRAALKT